MALLVTEIIALIGILLFIGFLAELLLMRFSVPSALINGIVGAIVGGTSSHIIMPLINGSSVHHKVKGLVSLESISTDVLSIVFAMCRGQKDDSPKTGWFGYKTIPCSSISLNGTIFLI